MSCVSSLISAVGLIKKCVVLFKLSKDLVGLKIVDIQNGKHCVGSRVIMGVTSFLLPIT